MIHGIIDIGSNTIRLNVYQINENNNFEYLVYSIVSLRIDQKRLKGIKFLHINK